MGTKWANSEDPVEMPHSAVFFQSLHCVNPLSNNNWPLDIIKLLIFSFITVLILIYLLFFQYKQWCIQLDKGLLPLGLLNLARESERASINEKNGATGGQRTNSTATGTELDISSESSDDEVEQLVDENSATNSETSDIKLSVGKMKHDLSGNSKREEVFFKLPRSKPSSTNVKSEASEFLSDLSAYSTIGISDLKPMSYSVESNKKRLGTVVEGIEGVEDTHVQSNLKIELPLLPTFQD